MAEFVWIVVGAGNVDYMVGIIPNNSERSPLKDRLWGRRSWFSQLFWVFCQELFKTQKHSLEIVEIASWLK